MIIIDDDDGDGDVQGDDVADYDDDDNHDDGDSDDNGDVDGDDVCDDARSAKADHSADKVLKVLHLL